MKDAIGDRMKRYEKSTKDFIIPRMPTIIRIDGKAFHTFTKGFEFPYDEILSEVMRNTARSLFKGVQNTQFSYNHSDEISLLLIDYQNINTDQWFGGCIQKMASVASSMATLYFNKHLYEARLDSPVYTPRMSLLDDKLFKAMFDARVFQVPKEDVGNYFLWRWRDCIRNSVSMAASAKFSAGELHGVGIEEMKRKLRYEENSPWEDMPEYFKDGCQMYKYELGIIREPSSSNIRDLTRDIVVRNDVQTKKEHQDAIANKTGSTGTAEY